MSVTRPCMNNNTDTHCRKYNFLFITMTMQVQSKLYVFLKYFMCKIYSSFIQIQAMGPRTIVRIITHFHVFPITAPSQRIKSNQTMSLFFLAARQLNSQKTLCKLVYLLHIFVYNLVSLQYISA